MKIFVTGGTGYIGSHTVVELQKNGYDVIIADNLVNSSLDVLDGIEKITGIRPEFEEIDLTDGYTGFLCPPFGYTGRDSFCRFEGRGRVGEQAFGVLFQ